MNSRNSSVAIDPSESRYSSFESGTHGLTIQPVLVGYEKTLPHYRVIRDGFPAFAVELVTAGRGLLTLGKSHHELFRGRMFTYGPGIRHEIISHPEDPLRKYFINIAAGADGSGHLMPESGVCLTTTMTERIESLADGIIRDHANGNDDPALRHHATALILHLARLPQEDASVRKSSAYRNYRRVRLHFESHYHLPGSVAEFADALHIDASYLTRLFQRFSTETPYRFLTRLRLARASHLLLASQLPVSEISETLGYADPFHFSTLFRRHYGMPPSQFRKRS